MLPTGLSSVGHPDSEPKQWSIRNTAMYLVDSDFDTEDEAYADDIEEVISNHVMDSEQTNEMVHPAPYMDSHKIGLKELQEKLNCDIIG